MNPFLRAGIAAMVVSPAPVLAQTVPSLEATPPITAPTAIPTPAATSAAVAPPPGIVVPVPPSTPPSRPTPAPRAIRAPRPAQGGTPSPRPAQDVAPAPPSVAVPTPASTPPAPAAVMPTVSAAVPPPDLRDEPPPRADPPVRLWIPGAALITIALSGFWIMLRRRAVEEPGALDAPVEPIQPVAAPTPDDPVVVPTAEVATPVADLALVFHPLRVGFDLLSATVEGELTIINVGGAAAGDVRVRTALLGVHAGQDEDLTAFVAEPIGQPIVAPFALAGGGSRAVRVVAAAPREGLPVMTVAGRPMFVPVMAISVQAEGAQVAHAFAIGMQRDGSPKLAPFWLDLPPRDYDRVAVRVQA